MLDARVLAALNSSRAAIVCVRDPNLPQLPYGSPPLADKANDLVLTDTQEWDNKVYICRQGNA